MATPHSQRHLAAWGLPPWTSANAIFRAPLAFCQLSGLNGGDRGSISDAVGLPGVLAVAAPKPEEHLLYSTPAPTQEDAVQNQRGPSCVSCFPFIFLIERNENGPTRRLESPAVHRAGWESKRSVRIGWLYGAYKTESSLSFIYLFFHLPFKLCAVHS